MSTGGPAARLHTQRHAHPAISSAENGACTTTAPRPPAQRETPRRGARPASVRREQADAAAARRAAAAAAAAAAPEDPVRAAAFVLGDTIPPRTQPRSRREACRELRQRAARPRVAHGEIARCGRRTPAPAAAQRAQSLGRKPGAVTNAKGRFAPALHRVRTRARQRTAAARFAQDAPEAAFGVFFAALLWCFLAFFFDAGAGVVAAGAAVGAGVGVGVGVAGACANANAEAPASTSEEISFFMTGWEGACDSRGSESREQSRYAPGRLPQRAAACSG